MNSQPALQRMRFDYIRRDHFRYPALISKPYQSGASHNNGVKIVFIQLRKAFINITADIFDYKIIPVVQDRLFSFAAARADPRPRRKLG